MPALVPLAMWLTANQPSCHSHLHGSNTVSPCDSETRPNQALTHNRYLFLTISVLVIPRLSFASSTKDSTVIPCIFPLKTGRKERVICAVPTYPMQAKMATSTIVFTVIFYLFTL